MSPAPSATSQHDHDHALLAAGHDTGWWDKHGQPSPWPEDFWLPDGTINPDWHPSGHDPKEEPEPATAPENHNF